MCLTRYHECTLLYSSINLSLGVSPAFGPKEDFSVVTAHLPAEYARAVLIQVT